MTMRQRRTYDADCVRAFEAMSDSDLFSDKVKHVAFYHEVTPESVGMLRSALDYASRQDDRPIVLHLHSPGGDGTLGIAMANMIREVAVPIAVMVDGYACSAVTPMLVSAPYRIGHQYCFVMVHEGAFVFESGAMIKNGMMMWEVKAMSRLDAKYRAFYTRHTRIPPETLDDMLSRDLYMDASTAAKYGVLDRVMRFDHKATRKVWASYKRRMPKASDSGACDIVGTGVRQWTGCKHVYAYSNDTSSAAVAPVIHVVAPVQSYMLEPDPRPPAIVIHYNAYMLPAVRRSIDVAPLIVRICASPAPVVGIIDSDIDIMNALPCIVSHRRYMYEDVDMHVCLVHDHLGQSRTSYYHDIKANTEMLRAAVRDVLSRWTKLPRAMLATLFEKRVVLSARDCLRYGIVDEVLPARRRHRNKA